MIKNTKFLSLIIVATISITYLLQPQVNAYALSPTINPPTVKADIISELITLKSKKLRLQKQIALLDKRLSSVDNHLNQLAQKIIDTEFELNKQMKVLSKRAKAMYEQEYNSSLQLILGSKTIYELITRLDFLGLIVKQDIKLIDKSKRNRKKLIKLKNDYLSKRQKIVTLKRKKEETNEQNRIVKISLQRKLKVVSKEQLIEVNKGLETAKFYDKYLSSKQSPMTGLGGALAAAGRQFLINPDIVVAIAGVESGFGKHNANAYNAWGRKTKAGGYRAFASWEAGVFNQTQYLKEKYSNIGRKNLVSIGAKYAPGNQGWPGKVSHFLDDIKDFREIFSQ